MSEHDEPADRDADTTADSALARSDPRLRPPDPAGTQPKFDPADLLPARMPGSLWAEHPVDSDIVATDSPPPRDAQDRDEDLLPERVATPARGTRFTPRFQFITGALMAVAAAAVVLAVLIIVDDNQQGEQRAGFTGPAWSAWQPAVNGIDGPTQIAEHVADAYRLPDHRQLVAVTGGPLEIAGLPVTVAVRETAAQGGDIELVDGTGVLYRMCGLGDACAIPGTPSMKRGLLLRREALELALYSFRYLGVEQTVVFLPPSVKPAAAGASAAATTEKLSVALLFRRQDADLTALVARPLRATLVPRTPSVTSVTRSPDAQLVDSVTLPKQFEFSFKESNQDARAFLVLDPLTG